MTDPITRNGNATTPYRIRVVPLEGNPWFVLADAAHAFGYAPDKGKGGNSFYNSLRGIASDQYRSLAKRDAPDDTLFTGTTARMVLISEAGLYGLIARSNKPEARVLVKRSTLLIPQGTRFQGPAGVFLTRAGVHQLLMASTKPAAKEFREWLAGEVAVAMGAFSAGGLRIPDTDLAANLGMPTPANIRKNVITPNRTELEGFGVLARGATTSGPRGGRPGTAFYLNEEQALLVCLLSHTERAKAVRAEVIRVFTAYRRGDLVATSVRRYLDHSPAQSAAG